MRAEVILSTNVAFRRHSHGTSRSKAKVERRSSGGGWLDSLSPSSLGDGPKLQACGSEQKTSIRVGVMQRARPGKGDSIQSADFEAHDASDIDDVGGRVRRRDPEIMSAP